MLRQYEAAKALCYPVLPPSVRYKLVLITNRKSLISFRLVLNSVTLNDLERRDGPNRGVILPNLVAFGGGGGIT